MLLKITPILPEMSAKKSCPNFLGGSSATGGHTVCKPILVMKTGFPGDENRFFPV